MSSLPRNQRLISSFAVRKLTGKPDVNIRMTGMSDTKNDDKARKRNFN